MLDENLAAKIGSIMLGHSVFWFQKAYLNYYKFLLAQEDFTNSESKSKVLAFNMKNKEVGRVHLKWHNQPLEQVESYIQRMQTSPI